MNFFRSRSRLCVLLSALAVLPAAVAVAQPTPAASDDEAKVRSLYRKAATAFAASKYEEARTLFTEAWQLRRSYDVAAALGQTELELKRYRDAAEHLHYAVQNFAPVESEKSLDALKADLKAAKARVAEVKILVNEPKAEVLVNGKLLGAAPLPAPVFVEAGTYQFEARLGADRTARKQTTLDANNSYTVELIVPKGASPASVSPVLPTLGAQPVPTDHPGKEANWIPTYVTGGLAIVALGVGTGFGLNALSAKSKAEDKLAEAEKAHGTAGTCTPGNGGGSGYCDDLKDLQDERKSSNTTATVSFVVGGVLAAASVGSYFLWARQPDGRETKVGASIGGGGGSLLVQGTF